jgi:proliferating cell nuclear antigen
MFEATLQKASTLKKVIEAIKDLVTDGNIEVSETGMNLQAMDSSHVSLVSLVLHTDMFEHFRCDRNVTLGINLPNFAKILKCSGNDDSVTLKAQDDGENLAIVFESEGQERVSEFELKLMDIDAESLGIPDQDYNTNVKMSSAEFQRIVRDMTVLGDTCSIGCTKEGVKFSVSGDLGQGNITLRQTNSVDKEEEAVTIEMDEPVELNFALRYLGFFTKASPLCPRVTISMSPDVPIVVAYNVGGEKDTEGAGSLSFYLAPISKLNWP